MMGTPTDRRSQRGMALSVSLRGTFSRTKAASSSLGRLTRRSQINTTADLRQFKQSVEPKGGSRCEQMACVPSWRLTPLAYQGDFRRKNTCEAPALKLFVSCNNPAASAKLVLTFTQTTRSLDSCKTHG